MCFFRCEAPTAFYHGVQASNKNPHVCLRQDVCLNLHAGSSCDTNVRALVDPSQWSTWCSGHNINAILRGE